MRTALEAAANQNRFNLSTLTNDLIRNGHIAETQLTQFQEILENHTTRQIKKIYECLIRNIFFIEVVNRDITSTKYDTRWSLRESNFEFHHNDARWQTFENCLEIFNDKITELLALLHNDPINVHTLNNLQTYHQTAYEIPLDYVNKIPIMHTNQNINW